MSGTRKIIVGMLIAGIIGLIVWGYRPQPVMVDTADARIGSFRVTVREEGKTRVVDRFVVSAPVAGFTRRIELEVGDSIENGQVIATVEPLRPAIPDPRGRAEAQARVAAAEAALKAAQENQGAAEALASLADAELSRIQNLIDGGYATVGRLDRAVAEKRKANAELKSARFAVDVSRFEREAAGTALRFAGSADHERTITIRSPISGNVLKVYRESEGVVSAGQPIIELGDPSALEIEVDVLSEDAVRIEPGMKVLFDRWGGEAPLEGLVRTVEPAGFTKISALGVEEQRVLVISDITSPRDLWRRVGDGYRLEAEFILWEGTDVLQVPAGSLLRHGEGWAVFTVDGNRASLRGVEIGRRNGLSAQVLSGLRKGEKVIVHPDREIEDGITIKIRQQ